MSARSRGSWAAMLLAPVLLALDVRTAHGAPMQGTSQPAAAPSTAPSTAPTTAPVSAPTTVLIRVVEAGWERPLANAEVSVAPLRRLTNADGEVRFTWPRDGSLAIRVRQIGFTYVDRTLRRSASEAAEDTVVVPLGRAPFALPQMVTRVNRRCPAATDHSVAALSESSMELLRFGAEQYGTFSSAYPFRVTFNRRTERRVRGSNASSVDSVMLSSESSTWGDLYKPGKVLHRDGDGFSVAVLFVSSLADSAFWDRHCFNARGVETRNGRRTIRLDFSAAPGVRDIEWEGTAWLDSAASVLTRIDFRLANLRYQDPVRRFEGFTNFSVLSPYIAIPDFTEAWWWSRTAPPKDAGPTTAEQRQEISVRIVRYLRGEPPPQR